MAWEPSEYKKDVTGEMPNAYDPKSVEGCWGEFWEKEGLMGADAEVRERKGECDCSSYRSCRLFLALCMWRLLAAVDGLRPLRKHTVWERMGERGVQHP